MSGRETMKKVGEIAIEEIKQQLDETPLVPNDEENKDLGDYQFRPLTRKEKKEFIDSLDAKGRKILAELAGKADKTDTSLIEAE
jgi:hypothetical protein